MIGVLALAVLALAVWATKLRGRGAEYNRGRDYTLACIVTQHFWLLSPISC